MPISLSAPGHDVRPNIGTVTPDSPSPYPATWSRNRLERSRLYTAIVGSLLGLSSLVWLAGLSEGNRGNAAIGVAIIELFTLPGAIYCAYRARHLSKLMRINDRVFSTGDEQHRGEKLFWRLNQLRGPLDSGPLGITARVLVEEAERTIHRRAQLTARLEHLDGVRTLLDDDNAIESLQLVADRCRSQIADIDRALADVAGSLADIANAAEAGKLSGELAQVHEEAGRLAAIARALRELNAENSP